MPTGVMRIFVSSTWLDLQPERRAVEEAINRMSQAKFIGMEYFGSRPETTQQASLDEVDQCEIYLGIIAGRYGSGITEQEYRRAVKQNKQCFIYFKDEEATPVEWRESDPAGVSRLNAFKEELRGHHIIGPLFSTPEELAMGVRDDLYRWFFRTQMAEAIAASTVGAIHTGREDGKGIRLGVGPADGSVIDPGAIPTPRPRPTPLQPSVRPMRGLLGRKQEIGQASNDLKTLLPVELYGAPGIGKTSLLRHLAYHYDGGTFPEGAIYLDEVRRQGIEDLLQFIFDSVYECVPAYKPSPAEVRARLRDKRALIMLDDVELEMAGIERLINALPEAGFALASEERRLIGEARALLLPGLPVEEARQLLERELGRQVGEDERSQAETLCALLGGNPRRILGAAAMAREQGLALSNLIEQMRRTLGEAITPSESSPPDREEPRKKAAALLSLLESASREGRHRDAIRIGREVEATLILNGQWEAWGQTLERIGEAARATNDQVTEAWAWHQQGTRAMCLGEDGTARELLTRALNKRYELGENTAAAITRHNLDWLLPPVATRAPRAVERAESTGKAKPGPRKFNWLWWLGGALLLAVVTGYAIWNSQPDGGGRGPEPTPTVAPSPEISPTPEPLPTVTVEPSPEVSPEPTLEPTPTPFPTLEPSPTPSPKPTEQITQIEIRQFTAIPPSLRPNERARLCYDVLNARAANIQPGIGAIDIRGGRCLEVAPLETTTYTLTAIGRDGRQLQRQATVEVLQERVRPTPRPTPRPLPGAEINRFTATPTSIPAGQSSSLCWATANARRAFIEPDVGPVEPVSRGCVRVSPSRTTRYRLAVEGLDGRTLSQDAEVEVLEQRRSPVAIDYFTAKPEQVELGGRVNLCFRMSNAAQAEISPGVGRVRVDAADCVTVAPKESTRYLLTAAGRDQRPISRSVYVTVNQPIERRPRPPALRITFFTAEPARVRIGAGVQLCYGIENGSRAEITPMPGKVPVAEKNCVKVGVKESTTFTLTAYGTNRQVERKAVRVEVVGGK